MKNYCNRAFSSLFEVRAISISLRKEAISQSAPESNFRDVGKGTKRTNNALKEGRKILILVQNVGLWVCTRRCDELCGGRLGKVFGMGAWSEKNFESDVENE